MGIGLGRSDVETSIDADRPYDFDPGLLSQAEMAALVSALPPDTQSRSESDTPQTQPHHVSRSALSGPQSSSMAKSRSVRYRSPKTLYTLIGNGLELPSTFKTDPVKRLEYIDAEPISFRAREVLSRDEDGSSRRGLVTTRLFLPSANTRLSDLIAHHDVHPKFHKDCSSGWDRDSSFLERGISFRHLYDNVRSLPAELTLGTRASAMTFRVGTDGRAEPIQLLSPVKVYWYARVPSGPGSHRVRQVSSTMLAEMCIGIPDELPSAPAKTRHTSLRGSSKRRRTELASVTEEDHDEVPTDAALDGA